MVSEGQRNTVLQFLNWDLLVFIKYNCPVVLKPEHATIEFPERFNQPCSTMKIQGILIRFGLLPVHSDCATTLRQTLSEKLLIGRKEAQKAQEKLEKNHFVA